MNEDVGVKDVFRKKFSKYQEKWKSSDAGKETKSFHFTLN